MNWRTEEWLDISIKSLDKFSKMKEAIDITNLSIIVYVYMLKSLMS